MLPGTLIPQSTRLDMAKNPQLRFPGFTGEWEEKKLGSFLTQEIRVVPKPSGPYKGIGLRSHFKGTFQRLESDPAKIAMDELFLVNENDLIVNITFAWEGALALAKQVDSGGLVSHRFPTYTFNEEITNPRYFQYVFPTKKMKYMLDIISPGGAGRNRVLNKGDFLKIKVNLPTLPEQQKISIFLESIDVWIKSLRGQKEALESYKKEILKKIFNQGIRFKDDAGKYFPKWARISLGDMGFFYRGHSYSAQNVKDHGLLVLRSSNIQQQKLVIDQDLQFVDKDCNEQIVLRKHDIAICMANGSKNLVGKAGEYLGDCAGKVTVGAFCSIYRSNIGLSKYLFQTVQYKKYLHILLAGTNISNFKNSDLSNLEFSFPTSPNEQDKITAFLMSIDNLIESKKQQVHQAEEWKRGLMQRLFV